MWDYYYDQTIPKYLRQSFSFQDDMTLARINQTILQTATRRRQHLVAMRDWYLKYRSEKKDRSLKIGQSNNREVYVWETKDCNALSE